MIGFILSALLAVPAAASVSYEVEPRVEALSVALRLAEPGSFEKLESEFPDGYARDARAAFAPFASHPAVADVAAKLKAGESPRALARLVLLEPGSALAQELRAFEKAAGFPKFFAAHRDAHKGFVERARAESLRAMSPASLEAFLGRPFTGDHRFLLAPLFPEDPAGEFARGWRSGRRVLHLRPRAGGPRPGFRLDGLERSVAVALAYDAVGPLKPESAEIRDHLAVASALRVLAADLGEQAFLHALGDPALKSLSRLDAVAEDLKSSRRTAVAHLYVDAAERAAKAGDKPGALENLAAADGAAPEVGRRALTLLIQLKEYARAQTLLDGLLAAAPADEALRLQKAALAAQAAAGAAPAAASPADALLLDRATLAAGAGKRDEALARLSELRAQKPDAAARRRIADLYRDLGESASAREVLDGLIKEFPADAGPVVSLAALYARGGMRAAAERELAKAKGLNPDAAARRRMAALAAELGDRAGAKAELDALIAAAPSDAGLRLDRAALAADAGRRDDALADLAKAGTLKPDAADRRRQVELYARLGDLVRARAALELLAKSSPSDSGLRRRQASLSRAAGRDGEARALLDRLLQEEPNDAGLLLDRAELAVRARDAAGARNLLLRVEALAPGREERRRMAFLRQELKDYDAALALLSALVAEKADAATLGDLGVCKVLAGKSDEAIVDLRRAIALEPGVMPPYLTLASIYAARKDSAAELAVYDSAPAPADQPRLAELLTRGRKEAAARAGR